MDVTGLHVLLVEAATTTRRVLGSILRDLGVDEITAVGDAPAALDAMASSTPDVVICNVALPTMDGVELLRTIAARDIDVSVIVSGSVEPSLLRAVVAMSRAYGLRVLAGVPLPLSLDRLRSALERHEDEGRVAPTERSVPMLTPTQIARAMADGAIVPYFQPILDVRTGRPVAVEALVRWMRDGRLVTPADVLVDAMERLGMIGAFTDWMVEQACEWQAEHGNRLGIGVAVNASLAGLSDVDFPDRCAAAVRAAGCDPACFTLEITETSVMRDVATALDILARLRLMGLRIAIDDFGTGYSSLQQLTTIPCTDLKIDKAFVTGAANDERRCSVLDTAVELAHLNGMTAVAEGCESQLDLTQLQAVDCDLVQGYHFSRPLPASELVPWLEDLLAPAWAI